MTRTNIFKGILGFAIIVQIVPFFFNIIYKISQQSESTQHMNGVAGKTQVSVDRAKALQSQPDPKAKSDKTKSNKTSSYSADLGRLIQSYNKLNRFHITSVKKYNQVIDLMNARNDLRTPEAVTQANQAKATIDDNAAVLEMFKEGIEKDIVREGFTTPFEPDQKAPVVKVINPVETKEVDLN